MRIESCSKEGADESKLRQKTAEQVISIWLQSLQCFGSEIQSVADALASRMGSLL